MSKTFGHSASGIFLKTTHWKKVVILSLTGWVLAAFFGTSDFAIKKDQTDYIVYTHMAIVVIGIMLQLTAVFIMFKSFINAKAQAEIYSYAMQVNGYITRTDLIKAGKNKQHFQISYEFNDLNEKTHKKSFNLIAVHNKYKVGDQITVIYHRDNPARNFLVE